MDERRAARAVVDVLEGAVADLRSDLPRRAFERVLTGERALDEAGFDGDPGAVTRDRLVDPLLGAAGLSVDRSLTGPAFADRSSAGPVAVPAFRVANVDVPTTDAPVVGAVAPIGRVEAASAAVADLVGPFREPEYGVATDGAVWRLHRSRPGGGSVEAPIVSAVDLRSALRSVAVDRGILGPDVLAGEVSMARRVDEDLVEAVASGMDAAGATGGRRATDGAGEAVPDRPEPARGGTAFALGFERSVLGDRIDAAPRELRERRRRRVEAFYDRYVGLLFGEGTDHDVGPDLLSGIEGPPGADPSDADRRLFALVLANRLLFVRVLERRGAIPDGLLADVVRSGEEGSLYGSAIAVLFDLLSAPPGELPDDQDGWRARVPPLGCALFAPVLDRERDYRVEDRALWTALGELAGIPDGSGDADGRPDGGSGRAPGSDAGPLVPPEGLDPAVVGAAFEKVTNHLGARPDVGLQKEELGAVYTPPDLTERVVGETVDPAIRDAVVEVLVEHARHAGDGTGASRPGGSGRASPGDADGGDGTDGDCRGIDTAVRSALSTLALGELLDRFVAGRDLELAVGDGVVVPFAADAAAAAALDAVADLTVLDPACGSGQFLAAAMDRLSRARLALRSATDGGEEPSPRERLETNRRLALSSVYGVDVHRAAVEVARLRVWLTLLPDGGVDSLPNVDANVVHGNALVGLPASGVENRATVPDADLSALERHRLAYKYGDDGPGDGLPGGDPPAGDRGELDRTLAAARPALDDAYLSGVAIGVVEDAVDGPDEFRRLAGAVPEGDALSAHVEHVTARPVGGGTFTDEQRAALAAAGFEVYHTGTTANLDVAERERTLADRSGEDTDRLVDDLADLLDGAIRFATVKRRPLAVDLAGIEGDPLHWPARFPEAVTGTASGPAVEFDVILGNPPYGDLLSDAEKRLLAPMRTGDGYERLTGGEIAGNFLERQLDLLAPDGYLGNVVTVGVLSSSRRGAEHDLLTDRLGSARISSFARRPGQVFNRSGSRVEINPAVVTGRPVGAGSTGSGDDEDPDDVRGSDADTRGSDAGGIRSSDFLRFDADSRAATVRSHDLGPVEGLFLRDRMGSERRESGFDVFPKVGDPTKRSILETLVDQPEQVWDWEVEDSSHVVRHRRSFNYWLVATRGGDDLNNMREYAFPDRLTRDLAFLAANSSLLYVYHTTYGNMQDFGKARFRRFPVPSRDRLAGWAPLVHDRADAVAAAVRPVVDGSGDADYEGNRAVKPTIDEAEALLGAIYGLDDRAVAYLRTYHAEFARRGPGGYESTPAAGESTDRAGAPPDASRRSAFAPGSGRAESDRPPF